MRYSAATRRSSTLRVEGLEAAHPSQRYGRGPGTRRGSSLGDERAHRARRGGSFTRLRAALGSVGASISQSWFDGRVTEVILGSGSDFAGAVKLLQNFPEVR